MDLITKRVKIPVPIYQQFKIVEPVYQRNANDIISPYHRFVNNNYCKGDVIYSLGESTVRTIWGLGLGKHACSNSDGHRVLTDFMTNEEFEIRSMMDGTYWGPSTSVGKDREPKAKAPRSEWLAHDHDVMNKIHSIDNYIIIDIAYPPYWFIYEVPRNSVLSLYEEGTLQWQLGDHRDGLVRNKISRCQFYTYFFKMKKHNPHRLDWDNKEVNPFKLSSEDIQQNIKMLKYDTTNTSWIKIKKQDKDLVKRSENENLDYGI